MLALLNLLLQLPVYKSIEYLQYYGISSSGNFNTALIKLFICVQKIKNKTRNRKHTKLMSHKLLKC
jgi:hypothetical protein